MEQRRARGMLAAAAVIFGTLAPFVRGISVSSGELALYRAVMAALLVGGYLLVSGQKLALRANRREAALLLLSGMAMGVNWILLFEAYRYTTVSVATLSYYFAPVLVTAACPLLFHERLTGKQIVCFVMSTLGLVLVIGVGGLRGGRGRRSLRAHARRADVPRQPHRPAILGECLRLSPRGVDAQHRDLGRRPLRAEYARGDQGRDLPHHHSLYELKKGSGSVKAASLFLIFSPAARSRA